MAGACERGGAWGGGAMTRGGMMGLIEGRGNGIYLVKLNLFLLAVYIAAVMFYVGCYTQAQK